MGKSTQSNKKFDLLKLQRNYFEACVNNVVEANKAIQSAQNWILILGLAEMSFLGGILLQSEKSNLSAKIILSVLLFGFFIFVIGSVKQYKHLLSSARYYENLSNLTLAKIEKNGHLTNDIPQEVRVDKNQIKSDKVTNILIFSSFTLILISTVALIIFIFCL